MQHFEVLSLTCHRVNKKRAQHVHPVFFWLGHGEKRHKSGQRLAPPKLMKCVQKTCKNLNVSTSVLKSLKQPPGREKKTYSACPRKKRKHALSIFLYTENSTFYTSEVYSQILKIGSTHLRSRRWQLFPGNIQEQQPGLLRSPPLPQTNQG